MRNIKPEMIHYLDNKLRNNGAAQFAIKNKDPRSLLIYSSESCVGIRESGGNNNGPIVRLMQSTIGRAGREPWCMSFVQTLIAYCEWKTGVRSPIIGSEHCLSVWRHTPFKQRVLRVPAPGAVIIWRWGNSESGHCGILTEYMTRKFSAVEGNTEKGIIGDKVVREGGGVYETIRSTKGDGDMKVVGYLKPF